MSHRRRILLTSAVLAGAVQLATVVWLLRDPLPHVQARRSALASAVESEPTIIGNSEMRRVRLVATSGLVVDVNIRRHLSDSSRRLPVVLLLGGHVTGAEAAHIVGETRGVLVAGVSYPFDGDLRPSKLTFLTQIPSIRRAFHDTPAALMIALDYLVGHPNADPTRVHGIGVSLGAPFMTIAGALDTRFTDIWAIHGSGGSFAPLEASMRRSISILPLRYLSAAVANVIIAGPRLAPERWAPQIAPRRFIMVNATDDERLPRASVDALYRSASEPKEQIWMSGGHINADAPTIQRVVQIVMERVSPEEEGLE
jgi:hypothetical protein